MFRTALLFIVDAPTGDASAPGARGESPVQAVRDVLAEGPFVEVDYERVPDEQALIRAKLRLWCDRDGVDLILTCGGIGLGLRERAPEAMREVVERELPGLGEHVRAELARHDPLAVLTRGTAGLRRRTLVVNLPGDAAAAGIAARSLLPVLPHALGTMRDAWAEEAAPGGPSPRPGRPGGPDARGAGAEDGDEDGGAGGRAGREARPSWPRGGRGG